MSLSFVLSISYPVCTQMVEFTPGFVPCVAVCKTGLCRHENYVANIRHLNSARGSLFCVRPWFGLKAPRTVVHVDKNAITAEMDKNAARTTIQPDCEAGIPIADHVRLGKDVLVLGKGRRGRVDAALTGARARRAQAVLVIVHSLRAVYEVAEEAEEAYPEARVVISSLSDEGLLRNPARSASNHKGPVVVVGMCMGVGDAFLQNAMGRDWLQSVELLVLFDVRFLSEHYWRNMLRALTRLATYNGCQVVSVADSLENFPDNSPVNGILREGHETVIWNDHKYVIQDADTAVQRFASVSPTKLLAALAEVLENQYCLPVCKLSSHDKPYKVAVFFQNARLAQIYATLCRQVGLEMCEIHSGKTRSHNFQEMRRFQAWKHSLLFTCGEVTEGAELANISLIVQLGLPQDAKQYKSRIREMVPQGSCLTILLGYEVNLFLQSGCMPSPNVATCRLRGLGDGIDKSKLQTALELAQKSLSERIVQNAYASWLAQHVPIMSGLGWTQQDLIRRGWQWAFLVAGLDRPPALPERIVRRLGLMGADGVDVITGPDPEAVRRQGINREPDMHGKIKKRKPRGRFYYGMQRFFEGDYEYAQRVLYLQHAAKFR